MKGERGFLRGQLTARLAAEFVIIVAGVLVALYADRWNSNRLDRAEEREIIDRLISDVEADIRDFERGLTFLPRKEASLLRVDSVLGAPEGRPEDPVDFLGDVIYGAQYGWNQNVAQRITFDELLGSGAFGLIQDSALRTAISDYYEVAAGEERRIDERETEYPPASYRLVPRQDEFELEPGLSEAQLERLVAGVLGSSLQEHVISEVNLARFVRRSHESVVQAAMELLSELEAYRSSLD